MTKLTNTQVAVLASACQREDGLATRPASLRPAAAVKVAAKLIELGLVREVRAKGDAPVWREDEQGRAYGLKILKAGRAAMPADAPPASPLALAEASAAQDAGVEASATYPEDTHQPVTDERAKAGSKRAMVIGLLQRGEGATIDDLIAATDWLPHTTRAALSGLRKGGLAIERSKAQRGTASVYRIATTTMSAAA